MIPAKYADRLGKIREIIGGLMREMEQDNSVDEDLSIFVSETHDELRNFLMRDPITEKDAEPCLIPIDEIDDDGGEYEMADLDIDLGGMA